MNETTEYEYLVVANISNGTGFIPLENEDGEILFPAEDNPEKTVIKKDLLNKVSEEAWQVLNILYTSPDELMGAFNKFSKRAWDGIFQAFPSYQRKRIKREIYNYLKDVVAL